MTLRTILLLPLSIVITAYLTICATMFVEQRQFIYFPDKIVLDAPPAGSGYALLTVKESGLGELKDWWAAPTSPTLPTVVFFHGNAASRADFMDLGRALHSHGWGVVLASYRGYSGNPGTPTEDGLLADARATLAAVPHAGPIIVWGHSLGSGVAARMASEGRAAGLVLEAPYTSLPDVGARLYPSLPVRWLMQDRFDTRALIGRIHVPVLIFHSTDDPQIPFTMSQTLVRDLGRRATFVPMKGLGHYPHQADLSGFVLKWAQDHCIGGCAHN